MKYIVVDSVKDGNRYFRKECREKQKAIVNEKCIELFTFAKEVVTKHMAKQGCLKALDVLDSTSGAVMLLEILEENAGEGYFVPKESLSQETAQEVWNILDQLRMGTVTETYENCTKERVLQIKELIQVYEQQLERRGQYDVASIYKTAIELLKTGTVVGKTKQDEVVISNVCKEDLRAAEVEFLELYTQGVYEEFQLVQELSESHLQGAKFFRSYGVANEVQYVFSQIQKKQAYGDVEIFYTSEEYEPYIEAVFNHGGIPYTMISRQLPVENKYLYMMKAILHWAQSDFAYEKLKDVFLHYGKYRNTFYREIRAGIGWRADRYVSYIQQVRDELSKAEAASKPAEKHIDSKKRKLDFCDALEMLVNIFAQETEEKISYQKVFWKLVEASRFVIGKREDYKYISNTLQQCSKKLKHLGTGESMEEVIAVLLREINVLTQNDTEATTAVCIQKLDGRVHILERKHVYVLGMSTTHFTNANVESPVLSDRELESFLDSEKGAITLTKNAEQKKVTALYRTISSRVPDGSLMIGYCGYDTVNLRPLSPSIPFLRLLQKTGVESDAVEYTGYQDIVWEDIHINENWVWGESGDEKAEEVAIDVPLEVFKTEAVEVEMEDENEEEKNESQIPSPIPSWSTTSLQELLSCPLQFYYHRILHLPVEDYQRARIDRWLSASDQGTLAHGIMEDYCNEVFLNKKSDEIPAELQAEIFEQIVDKWIHKILSSCPFVSHATYVIETELVKENCRRYLESMHQEFSQPSNPWIVVACEKNFEDIGIEFSDGADVVTLSFRGQIDRLDKRVDENGISHYRIIDYKSGGRDGHETEIKDHRSIQHVVYKKALDEMLKQETMNVDEVIFVHFFEENIQKQNHVLKGDDIKDFPTDVSNFVVDFMKKPEYKKSVTGDKTKDKNNKSCVYCTFKDICKEYIGDTL